MPEDMTPVLLTDREREWLAILVRRAAQSSNHGDMREMARATPGAYNSAPTDLLYRLEPR